jgi:hypothetical protein
MKTAELTGAALDWAIAKCEFSGCEDWNGTLAGIDAVSDMEGKAFSPSTDWAQGGTIIEREGMQLWRGGEWCASLDQSFNPPDFQTGTTPLIAAMRCYVASKLGDDVELPEELLSCAHD